MAMCPCNGQHACGVHAEEIRLRHAEAMSCPRYLRKSALEDLRNEFGADRVSSVLAIEETR